VFDAFRGLGARLIATGFGSELAAAPESLVAAAPGLAVEAAPDPTAAVRLALYENGAENGPPPHVILCGSLYMAGEVLALSRETWPT
jgi:dihydrofolate synthase/folylpolyglutamate synthase